MSYKKFKKQFMDLATTDFQTIVRAINNVQLNIDEVLSPIVSQTQNDSNILYNIPLIGEQVNNVNHLLNKKISGWKIVDIDTNSNVWRVNNTLNTNLILYLKCSADCVVSLEVF